ncbi:MAG: hypothetical protein U1F45_02455 [Burkholderiales bacterium]
MARRFAWAGPASCTRRWIVPQVSGMPRLTSGKLTNAFSAAMRQSQASASAPPPPIA